MPHSWMISKLLWSRCFSLPITMVQQHKIFNSHSQLQHCHWAFFTSSSPPCAQHWFILWLQVQDHKPDKVQNGVGPISRLVSVSIKCSEEQYSDVLSTYVIRKCIAEKGKKELIYELYICYIVEFTIIDVWSCVSNKVWHYSFKRASKHTTQ